MLTSKLTFTYDRAELAGVVTAAKHEVESVAGGTGFLGGCGERRSGILAEVVGEEAAVSLQQLAMELHGLFWGQMDQDVTVAAHGPTAEVWHCARGYIPLAR
jgi:hypothetical protein